MTPTSDERRKVASALRGDPNDTLIPQSRDGFEGMTYREAAFRFWNMCRRVRDAANVDIAYSTTSVLADLIDPTCNIDVMDTGERADYDCREHIMHCKNCGAEFGYVLYGEDGDVSMDDKPKFCPGCGARVTGGGDA